MKYHEMTKNYIFREFECMLTLEETSKLCFKSVRTVKSWDAGKPIPKECKRLMRLYKSKKLSHLSSWEGFSMQGDKLALPTGQLVTAQQVLTGVALLQIQSEIEIQTSIQLLKLARAIERIKNNNK
ncbi:phage protein [Vibrio fluvialis]|nr:phage protein [Vibrio fluvialis]